MVVIDADQFAYERHFLAFPLFYGRREDGLFQHVHQCILRLRPCFAFSREPRQHSWRPRAMDNAPRS